MYSVDLDDCFRNASVQRLLHRESRCRYSRTQSSKVSWTEGCGPPSFLKNLNYPQLIFQILVSGVTKSLTNLYLCFEIVMCRFWWSIDHVVWKERRARRRWNCGPRTSLLISSTDRDTGYVVEWQKYWTGNAQSLSECSDLNQGPIRMASVVSWGFSLTCANEKNMSHFRETGSSSVG